MTDLFPGCLDGSGASFAQQVLQFGEELFDRIEVRTVGGQEEQPGPGRANGGSDGWSLVGTQIVHDDDVAFAKRGGQLGLDVAQEDIGIDRAVDDLGSIDPVMPERGDACHRFPMTKRDFGLQPVTA